MSSFFFLLFFFFFYIWLEFTRNAQFHITPLQRVIRIMIMPYSTVHISPSYVHSNSCRNSSPGEYIWRPTQPRHTYEALITLLLISPTSEGWKSGCALCYLSDPRWLRTEWSCRLLLWCFYKYSNVKNSPYCGSDSGSNH